MLEDDARGASLDRSPVGPPREAVDRVAAQRLGQRKLVWLAVEGVSAAVDAVRPRHERLAAPAVAHAIDRVTVEHRPVAASQRAQTAPDLDDGEPPLAALQFELLA